MRGPTVNANVDRAGELLIRAEAAAQHSSPFTWLLFRPPWSSDYCSKACIYRAMHDQVMAIEVSPSSRALLIIVTMVRDLPHCLDVERQPRPDGSSRWPHGVLCSQDPRTGGGCPTLVPAPLLLTSLSLRIRQR
jgi:hypothetical protein